MTANDRELGSLDAVTRRLEASAANLDAVTRRLESEVAGMKQSVTTLAENDRDQFARLARLERNCAANHGAGRLVRPSIMAGGFASVAVAAAELVRWWIGPGPKQGG